jgi:integrase
MAIEKVTPGAIEALQAQLEREKVGARTRLKVHFVLHAAFEHALNRELVYRNPLRTVSAPRYSAKPIQPFDLDEARAFIAAIAGDRLEALYLLAILAGLRQGELFALQWKDIDFEHGTVGVRRSLQDADGDRRLADPKTGASKRSVALSHRCIDALHEHRRRLAREGLGGSPYVFPDTEGNPLRRQNLVRRSFKPLLEKADLRPIRFHDLRHTMASLMLQNGAALKVVQERLGHSKPSTTANTYVHTVPSMQRDAAEDFSQALSGNHARPKIACKNGLRRGRR